MNTETKTMKAIEQTAHCETMQDVRSHVDAMDDILVPLLVERSGYMLQAARIKDSEDEVRDEARIEFIVSRVRERAIAEGGNPDVIEVIYRNMMEAYIAYEHQEYLRLRSGTGEGKKG